MDSMALKQYLDSIVGCEDIGRLKDEFKIRDNWTIYLFGDQETIYSKVTQAFENSGKPETMKDRWNFAYDVGGGKTYYFDPGTVLAQVIKLTRHPDARNGDEDKINGEEYQVFAMFHPYQDKKMEGVSHVRALALAIAGFAEYIIREKITARFPAIGLNYIPASIPQMRSA